MKKSRWQVRVKLALKSIYTGVHLSDILILKAISFAFIVSLIRARRVCSPVKHIEAFLGKQEKR